MTGRRWTLAAGALLATATAAGCSLPGHSASPKATTPPTTHPAATVATTTTIPGIQASGARTVLSPIGLNVRAQPAATAKVLASAAQGATLAVLGYTAAGGGWYRVHGTTVTGWITARATLSAPGQYRSYSSPAATFGSLYPASWTVRPSARATSFVAPSGGGSITVVTGTSVATLPKGHAGYVESHSEEIVVCGVTSYLDGYTGPTPSAPYLAQISLPLDKTHALGIEASIAGASRLPVVRTFAASVSFPYPACEG